MFKIIYSYSKTKVLSGMSFHNLMPIFSQIKNEQRLQGSVVPIYKMDVLLRGQPTRTAAGKLPTCVASDYNPGNVLSLLPDFYHYDVI